MVSILLSSRGKKGVTVLPLFCRFGLVKNDLCFNFLAFDLV